ncbi:MAG: DMT family transporter [Theionarchaea archaeon]|nr:DMT family transporter [Theionarchaea archaeon]
MKSSDLGLLGVAFVWGFTFVAVKESLEFVSPFTFLFYRFLLAFLLLILVSFKKVKHMDRVILTHGIVIGIFLFLGYGFQTMGLQYTTPANTGFITGLSVVIVPFLSIFFLKKIPPLTAWIGVFCALVGLFFLSFQKLSMDFGDFLVLLGACSFAMHLILVGKYSPQHDPFLLTTTQIGTVAALSCLLGTPSSMVFNTPVVKAVIITAVFATVLAFLIQTTAQKHTPATRTAVIFAMEPVFAALSSYILIHEVFTVQKIVGCGLILLGMIITEMKYR